uniref:Ig-like domain-containing protein n=1 Tax=Oncorhynchus tshawytscha TaxID=74940 RepID=A0AAZ3P9I5_ONCTS
MFNHLSLTSYVMERVGVPNVLYTQLYALTHSLGSMISKLCFVDLRRHYTFVFLPLVEPHVRVSSMTPPSGRHPAMLMCSAYDFYPKPVGLTWRRDGQGVKSDVHSHLEYTLASEEKISCMLKHRMYISLRHRLKVGLGGSDLIILRE